MASSWEHDDEWFHKMLRISWLPEQLLASQEGLSSVELIRKYDRLFREDDKEIK
jgi:hypothetical protein